MSEDTESTGEEMPRANREAEAKRASGTGDGPPERGAGGATAPEGGQEAGTVEPGSHGSDGWAEETRTEYEPLEGGGHRVTRRTIRRRVTVEDVSEEIAEDLPPHAYRAPRSSTHPAPVG